MSTAASTRRRKAGAEDASEKSSSSSNNHGASPALLEDHTQQPEDDPAKLIPTNYDSDNSTDGGRLEKALTEDIYSLLYTADLKGPAFWFACIVFVAQLIILVLILIDLIDFTRDPPTTSNGLVNRLNIPPGTPKRVSIAQFFGVALTISFTAAQGDIIKGFEHLVNGYDPEVCKQNPSATRPKYLVAGVFQTSVGILMTTDLFILLMQSTDVIGMCLNFAALHFVQDIDDVAFTVASMGLVSERIQRECLGVAEIMIAARTRQRTWRMRRRLMLFLTIGLYAGYFAIASQQWYGRFRCKSIYVQFGDAYHPELAYYSGRFHSQGNSFLRRVNGRHFFIDESETIQLYYDTSNNAWVFGYLDEPKKPFLIKSTETQSFDVTTLTDKTWYANTPDGLNTVDWIALHCNECTTHTCDPEHGTCEDDICVCNDARIGINCERNEPNCGFYGLDLRTKVGLANIPGASFFFENQFSATNLTLAHRNVYIAVNYYDLPLTGEFNATTTPAFMIFSGRRWIIFGTETSTVDLTVVDVIAFWEFHSLSSRSTAEGLELLGNSSEFLSPIFFSSPVDYGTPSFGYDPSSVTWVFALEDTTPDSVLGYRPSDEDAVPAKLICTDCYETGECKNGGKCQEDFGYCSCTPFYEGYQCEYVYSCLEIGCFGGGTCNTLIGRCYDCIPGYSGNLCQFPFPPNVEKDPYFCAKPLPIFGPCKNKQKCDPFELQCVCKKPFYGEFCELSAQSDCSLPENGCQNGGVCDTTYYIPTCRCSEPYTGDRCAVISAPSARAPQLHPWEN